MAGSRVGIALGAQRVTACELGSRGRVRRSPLTRSVFVGRWTAGDASGLQAFFAALSADASRPISAHIALLAPVCECATPDLPRLGEPQTRTLLAEYGDRYFLRAPDDPALALGDVVSRGTTEGGSKHAARRFCATVDAAHLETIRGAAATAGVRVAGIFPAPIAQAAATVAMGSGRSTLAVVCGALDEGMRCLVWARKGRVLRMRGWPIRASTGVRARRLGRRTFAGRRVRGHEFTSLSSGMLTAAGAGHVRDPAFLTSSEYRRTVSRRRRRGLRRAVAGATLAVAAALLFRDGLVSELESLQAQRRAIASSVDLATQIRSRRETAVALARDLDALMGAAPLSEAGIGWLASRLPETAHVSRLRIRSDTLQLEGATAQPKELAGALRKGGCAGDLLAFEVVQQPGADAQATQVQKQAPAAVGAPFQATLKIPACAVAEPSAVGGAG